MVETVAPTHVAPSHKTPMTMGSSVLSPSVLVIALRVRCPTWMTAKLSAGTNRTRRRLPDRYPATNPIRIINNRIIWLSPCRRRGSAHMHPRLASFVDNISIAFPVADSITQWLTGGHDASHQLSGTFPNAR